MEKRRIIHSVQFLLLTVAFTAGCEPNRTPALTLVSDAETIPPMPEALATLTVEGPTPSSDGEPAQTRSPTAVPTIPETTASPEESHWDIIALAAGGEHTCALIGDAEFGDGYIQCWGKNDFGQLGDDTTTDSNRPVDLYWGGGDGIFRGVTAGWGHSCGFGDFLDEPVGGVYCWGYNKNGELGDGTDSNSPVNEYQVRVWGLHGVVAMAAGDDHTCALLGNGSVKCWGLNDSGQLGDGTTNSSNTPVEVKYLTGGVVSITAGWGHTCALIQDGGVRCWGDNQYGQLGDGTSVPYRAERGIVAGLPNDIVAIAAGGGHTCALRSSSQVLCWGNNQYGELGDGTSSNRNLPVYVNVITHSGDEVLQLAAGRHHTCARMNVNRVRCWGNNQFGQLGDGTNLASALPCTANTGGADISVIATGSWHTCAGTSQGEVLCWGKNTYGQLGNGTNTDSNTPVESLGAGESSAR